MNGEFLVAIDELVREKEISRDVVLDAIEAALTSAYKKHYGSNNNVRVNINRETGDIEIYMQRTVVERLSDIVSDSSEIHIEDALEIDPKYEVGDIVETQVKPKDFGRIAAQTAKQVVVQKIREAERSIIYNEYIDKVGEIAVGIIQRVSNDTVYIDIGKAEGILTQAEQVPGEKYVPNDRIKVYIMDVRDTTKGPQIFLSRSHPGFVKRLFELEVPEIYDGLVEIKSVSREAGSRTKMAVYSENENIDAVGSCVGTRGMRVQAVVDEIFGEKIDIILWDENPEILISSALSPAKTEEVFVSPAEKMAMAVVPDHQLSLAIGKEGQNVRLAARLTGWKIDIKSHSKYEEYLDEFMERKAEADARAAEEAERKAKEEAERAAEEAAKAEEEAAAAEAEEEKPEEAAETEVPEENVEGAEPEEAAGEEYEASEDDDREDDVYTEEELEGYYDDEGHFIQSYYDEAGNYIEGYYEGDDFIVTSFTKASELEDYDEEEEEEE